MQSFACPLPFTVQPNIALQPTALPGRFYEMEMGTHLSQSIVLAFCKAAAEG